MKRLCKISRIVLSLTLAVTVFAVGSAAMTVSAATDSLCTHPHTQILINGSTDSYIHAVSVYYENGEWAGYKDCTVTRTREWKEIYCPYCKTIIGTYGETCTEKHSENH